MEVLRTKKRPVYKTNPEVKRLNFSVLFNDGI